MNLQRESLDTSTQHVTSSQTTLHRRRLSAAKVVWTVAVVSIVGLSVATVPVAYTMFQHVCKAGSECLAFQLKPQEMPALRELGLSMGFYAAYMLSAQVVYMMGFWAIGAVISWKGPGDWLSLWFSLMMITFGASNILEIWKPQDYPVLGLLGASIGFLGYTLFYVSFFVFPDGRFVPRWGRWPVVVWIVYQASIAFLPGDSFLHPKAWPTLVLLPLVVGLFGTMVFAQIYRYRRVSGPVERQQTKWVVFGVAAAVTLALAAVLPVEAFQSSALKVLYALSEAIVFNLALLLIPLSIGIAILRYRLWDIDVIINRTLVYGTLTAILLLVYYSGVVLVQALLRSVTAQGSSYAAVASTLMVAALFTPLRRRIQKLIDRRFYRSKYDPQKTLEAFTARMRDEVDIENLSNALVAVVYETMKPAHVSLWLRPHRQRRK